MFHKAVLEMFTAQGGIFGWVSDSTLFLAALARTARGKRSAKARRR
jgi:hypothetical protein